MDSLRRRLRRTLSGTTSVRNVYHSIYYCLNESRLSDKNNDIDYGQAARPSVSLFLSPGLGPTFKRLVVSTNQTVPSIIFLASLCSRLSSFTYKGSRVHGFGPIILIYSLALSEHSAVIQFGRLRSPIWLNDYAINVLL